MTDHPYDPFEDEHGARFDLRQVLVFGIVRSRRWIATTAAVGLTLGIGSALLQPNTYTSQAKLFLRVGQREQVTFDTMIGTLEEPSSRGPTISDEVHMLSDRQIYARVAEKLGAGEILRPADPSRYDTDETPLLLRAMHEVQAFLYGFGSAIGGPAEGHEALRAASKILYESTELVTDEESSVITVLHTSNAPERARDYNRAIVDAFVERHAEQFSIDRYLEENRAKLEEAERKRDELNKAYFDLLESCGFYDFETQRPVLIEELEDQESELHTARTLLGETKAQHAALTRRLEGVPAEIRVVGSPQPNPRYTELSEEIDVLDVTLAGLEARIAGLDAWVKTRREELDRLRECEKQHVYLATARSAADDRYMRLMQRYDMLEGLAGLREETSNLRLMQSPDMDDKKVGPARGKIVLMGLLGGTAVGVLAALVRELLDRRLRYPHAIERTLGVRVLDVIPDVGGLDGEDERSAA